jgi:alpha-tubulin suppressor-like RCC1 family protein
MLATSARSFVAVAVAVLAAVPAGCQFSVDYSDTMYRCPAGRCPTGFTCVAGMCVKPDATPAPPCTSLLAVGHEHVCAVIAATGETKCWGHGTSGELGGGALDNTPVPQTAVGLPAPEAIAAGGRATYAIAGGRLWVWGANAQGQLGDGTTAERHTPYQLPALTMWRQIGAQSRGACGLLADGKVRCWGCAVYPADPSTAPHCTTVQPEPTLVPLAQPVTQLAVGHQHACALLPDATIWCWGRNDHGQLGNGATGDSRTPVKAALEGASAIAAGRRHTCAIKEGTLHCWGDGSTGQLGDDLRADSLIPKQVPGLSQVTHVTGGGWYTCAIAGGSAYCWGSNTRGQLGNGQSGTDVLSPTVVQGLRGEVVDIDAGTQITCARDALGVQCWGANTRGQLGQGDTTDQASHAVPVAVPLGCP